MRFIRGDTIPHYDNELNGLNEKFDKTHLIYLSNNLGSFVINQENYPIEQKMAYIFDKTLLHSTINTEEQTRLLIGPMDDFGNIVGV